MIIQMQRIQSSEHLPVPHFDREEHHHQRREPDPAGTEPEDARAIAGEVMLSCERGDDARESAETGKHPARAPTVARVKELRCGGIEHRVEVLQAMAVVSQIRLSVVKEKH
jgi:hypothetical protein